MKFKFYLMGIMALVCIIVGQSAWAQVLDSCDQWANYCSGGYCVYNNLWGDNAGPQCITAQSTTRWTVRSTQSGSGVKTYPNSSREMGSENITIGSLSSCSSSMNVSVPSSGDYCTAWDIWCPEEVMIWMNWNGAVGPWGSYVETATIGGVTWDVYKNGYPGFLRQNNVNSMTVDIKAILDYCVSKGWLSSNGVIEKIQGGFEITSTGGQESTFTMNSYSVTFSTGGGGTTTTTSTAATTTTTSTAATTTTTSTAGTTTSTGTGNCDCGTCNWYGMNIPLCCVTSSGWGWQDGGCNRTCVSQATCDSQPGGGGGSTTTTSTAATTTTTSTQATTTTTSTGSTTTTSTAGGGGSTCSPVDASISPGFTQNGAGTFCWTATSCSYINSWNMATLTINGQDFTNKWASGSSLPAKINGNWYIYYEGNYSWSHFELR